MSPRRAGCASGSHSSAGRPATPGAAAAAPVGTILVGADRTATASAGTAPRGAAFPPAACTSGAEGAARRAHAAVARRGGRRVKLGIISDIHGDPIALELAWSHLIVLG